MSLFDWNAKEKKTEYDTSTQTPAIRCSICTGEQSAGFLDKSSGRFREIMPIRSDRDILIFREKYGIKQDEKIRKIY